MRRPHRRVDANPGENNSHIQTYHVNQDKSLEELNPHGFPSLRIFHQNWRKTEGVRTSRCSPDNQDTSRLRACLRVLLNNSPLSVYERNQARGPGKRAGKRGGKRGGNLGFSSNVSSLFNFNHCSLDLVFPSWQDSFDTWGSSGCPSGYSFASHRLMINSKLYRFLRSWRPLIPGGTMM